MHVDFEIHGSFEVPVGTQPVERLPNLFRLPTGEIVSVHPVIEMASADTSDDHHDLTTSEAAAIGVHLDLYDRESSLQDAD
ncbi:hypothetical protein [Sphingobium sp.]|uniref:hypothetical protein n=1 Tax=Sphingobium sp. TaxID=1912891 RepID=UPI002E24D9BB